MTDTDLITAGESTDGNQLSNSVPPDVKTNAPVGSLSTMVLPELRALATRFHGELDQMPPVFSAKKINGVPAHKLARAGKEVPVKPARITIHSFELTALDGEIASFIMHVSSGGYVRSVAHELGVLTGCGAHLATLRRTQAGDFTLAQAISLEPFNPQNHCLLAEPAADAERWVACLAAAASALSASGDALSHGRRAD